MSRVKLHIFSTYLYLLPDAAFAATWVGPAANSVIALKPVLAQKLPDPIAMKFNRAPRAPAALRALRARAHESALPGRRSRRCCPPLSRRVL
eukprot:4883415-Prymnesium_polylepis.1